MEIHKAVIMGKVVRKDYCFTGRHPYNIPRVRELYQLVEHKQIWKGDLENPPLNKEDSLYIKDKNLKVQIIEKAKSTEGGYIYWTDYIAEKIEDEESEKRKLAAENEMKAWEDYCFEKREESAKMKAQKESTKNWWEFWK